MHTRYMERSNSMREKRPLDPTSAEEGQPERKRPALASVIVEALKMDSLQRLCSSLEPILRRVVSEEVERALAKLGPAKLTGRSSPKRIEGPDGRNLQLHFRSKLSLPLFTGGKVEGEQSTAIHVVLLDANTGHVVTTGPESFVKLDVVVLEGDFNKEDDDWTVEEFESHVVKEREGKRPLLTGDPHVTLREGVGTLGEITFTDNSSWIRSRKFRLGLKVSSGSCDGIRIREAKTDAFTVKDHRGELYKKHYPPALSDEVWRLEKIGKDGSFHKRLTKAGINVVEDFLRLVVRDSSKLRTILGSGMSNKMWDALIEHAKTCSLGAKLYVYYPEDARNIGVVFNDIYELTGLITGEQYYSADTLTDSQKVCSWYNDDVATRYGTETQNVHANSSIQMGTICYPQQNNMINNSNHGELLALGQPQSSSPSDFDTAETSSFTPYNGMADFFPEEEIRMRSNEMLESEDMQHLLRYINMGAGAEDTGYPYSSNFMPNILPSFTFDEDKTPSSGKAVVGWLKLKAALRWGIFIRKKAAERRAQLVELDDET